jgi:hypothetical protein
MEFSVIGSLGGLLGGLIAIYLLAKLWEWALFMRVLDDPVVGKLSSVAAAWATAGTLSGFGLARGPDFVWIGYLLYLIPALILGVFGYRRGLKIRAQDAADSEELAEDFR